ncbi:MAG: 2-dehydropantoate 2-reductase [Candidatus Promineifilaceae bacterium]|nr:2-dehydropantoate 2-reductase [Candidatus Promineifilaceae bacterium]
MRILVYGAGAVGSYLGGMLSRQGQDVTLLVRQETISLLQGRPLTIQGAGKDVVVRPELSSSLRRTLVEGAPFDLLLLGMKSYDVARALDPLVAFCPRPYPLLMTLQNGIGIEELVSEAWGASNVVAGSLTTPVSRDIVTQIRVERTDRGLGLAPVTPGQEMGELVALFANAGIETKAIDDYRAMKWSKALLNMVGNATSAIINRHPETIYRHTPTYNLEMEMLQEALAVMDAMALKVVSLPGAPARTLAFAVRHLPDLLLRPVLTRKVIAGRGNKMPSFHIDLAAGKRENEVLYHNGAVAAAGRKLGIPTPVNAALTDILLKMARREIDWKRYDGHPDRLVRDVANYRHEPTEASAT